jgi:hypothetical protein
MVALPFSANEDGSKVVAEILSHLAQATNVVFEG